MKNKLHTAINITIAGIAVIFATISFIVADLPADSSKTLRGVIVAAWVIGPPIYFFIEWVFLYKESDEYPLEKFKYSQELARNIWLAVTAILVALYFNGFSFN
jgi:hypothetical protein